jgi:hypothetical protein
MKKIIDKISNGNKTLVNGAVALFIVALIALGCTCGGGSGSAPPEYVGSWTGSDGSTLTIRNDGSGDYKSGSGGSEVTNGSVEIKDGKLSLTLLGFGKTLNIDEPPKNGQMKLEGIVYKSGGGSTIVDTKSSPGDTESSNKDTKTTGSGDVPSDSELQTLVKQTTSDFADAVENEDFSDFVPKTSNAFQKEFSASKMKEVFAAFITQKAATVPGLRKASDSTAQFSPKPKVESRRGKKVLVANGKSSASPNTVNFEYEYVLEDGDWKLEKIQIRIQ